MTAVNSPRGNKLLAALSEQEYQRLVPDLQCVELTSGQILHEPDQQIRYIYFPINPVICLMALMENGATTGVGIVGNEGMIGLPLFLGSKTHANQAIVEISGSAIRMRANVLIKACVESGLNALLHLYTQAVLTQTAQAAACNRCHRLKPALANCLLSIHDRIGGDELRITHELISRMMGVRRSGVTDASLELQQQGLIRCTRGLIRVLNRKGLEAASCECYELVKKEFDRLMGENVEGSRVTMWNGIERRNGELEHKKDLQNLLEINSRLLIAGIREQQARDEAEEANKAKDVFLATLSHELRTPLTAMVGWTRILRTTKLDEIDFARALETIERNAQTQAQLIEDMLDVSRIVAGKVALETQQLDLDSLIEGAIDVVRPVAESKNLKIDYALAYKIDSFVGDPKRLQQIVLNLLTNAVKFTPEGGSVEVRLDRVNGHAEISVRDTGQGIPREFLPHVFDRFRQANSANMKHSPGLGLGLAIAQHLVMLHGGVIHAESAGEGQGALFTVKLPFTLNGADAGDMQCSIRRNSEIDNEFECAARLDDLRLLVVDDDADTCELITFILEQCGGIVTTATSAREALDILAHSKIDILISDVGLPDSNGYELIREVRLLDNETGRNIPAVALTAYAAEEDQKRALSAGFQFHLPKPVEPSKLIAVLAHLGGRI
jgi:signal transduction histidine kinase/ActR/RegA family two-component response regulator